MNKEVDSNTFTQKDLMQHLLHAAQRSVTREEMTVQFLQAERILKNGLISWSNALNRQSKQIKSALIKLIGVLNRQSKQIKNVLISLVSAFLYQSN